MHPETRSDPYLSKRFSLVRRALRTSAFFLEKGAKRVPEISDANGKNATIVRVRTYRVH